MAPNPTAVAALSLLLCPRCASARNSADPNGSGAPNDADDIMCYHGHQLPELFLLGEQKCATTSLSMDLHDKWGVIHGAEKETHYFDHNGHNLSTFAKLFPPCGPHVVTFDGTPNNVLYSQHSLQFLKSTYGVARLKKTTFAMILCDPAQRAQSFTYDLGMYDLRWGSIGDTDFKAKASHPDLSYFYAFRYGLYDEIIDHVLQELGQLTIIPAPVYFTHPDLVIKELIEVIHERSGKTPPSKVGGNSIAYHRNPKPHPPIMEDIAPQDRPRIREYYANTVDRVYALANGADARVTLAPPLERWPAEVPQHFLETSPIMSARLRPLPWEKGSWGLWNGRGVTILGLLLGSLAMATYVLRGMWRGGMGVRGRRYVEGVQLAQDPPARPQNDESNV